MRNFHAIFLLFALFLGSCSQNPGSKKDQMDTIQVSSVKEDELKAGEPEFPLNSITIDFMSYWTYHDQYVKLYRDFTATDERDKSIKKEDFLLALTTGKYLPLLIHTKDSTTNYKLIKIPAMVLKDIGGVVADYAKTQLGYFRMEGKPVPKFVFKDVNGIKYSSDEARGKIILFKCWFIKCVACVKEMPELNELVQKYKNRKDILFVSLAIDDKKALQDFLSKTKFDYAVIPNQEQYMAEKLKVRQYPTHFLIDKNGILVKTVQNATETAEILEKLVSQ
jgi:peroxiredoxin